MPKTISRQWLWILTLPVWVAVILGAGVQAWAQAAASAGTEQKETILLRAYGVPTAFGIGPMAEGERQVMEAFREAYPWIDPVSTQGIRLPGARSMDMVPFMQIAGDIAPDALYVNFRQSQTYIGMKLLYPLDKYIENLAQVQVPNGSALSTEDYIEALRQGAGWERIEQRVPPLLWQVMRRQCPYQDRCPHRKADDLPPLENHLHIWTYPVGPIVAAMQYDRTLLAEHDLPMRTPHDWDELLEWAKIMTDPEKDTVGFRVSIAAPGWTFANFLYAAGGKVVERNDKGEWYCVFDTQEAVDAAYFWARLKHEKVMRDGKMVTRGVIRASQENTSREPTRYGLGFNALDDQFFKAATDQTQGVGPVPAGPTGLRRSEFNSRMLGIFSGLSDKPERRDAAWAYIQFYDGTEAREIRTTKLVEAGLGPYVRRELLEQFNTNGRYDSVIRRIPPGLEETYQIAMAGGVPEPYGKNCQGVYDQMAKPLGAIWNSSTIRDAIDRGDEAAAKAEIQGILSRATKRMNQKMLGNLPVEVRTQRNWVAWTVVIGVVVIFAFVFRLVLKAFTPPEIRKQRQAAPRRSSWILFSPLSRLFAGGTGPRLAGQEVSALPLSKSQAAAADSVTQQPQVSGWRRSRYLKAWIIMSPALLLIGMWMYWPLLQGTSIAFQNYSVLGDSEWVGAQNFADVLYNGEFWYSLKISLYYAMMFIVFGFWVPIGLALLLSEVPRGKIFFRTIYYLPAVLSGIVVIFLWKSFYGPDGMINQVLNGGVWLLNHLPGVAMAEFKQDWLESPGFALFFCLLPTVWAGMGPGCLIYLAALKTIPDDLYEAADIDGAAIRHKLFHVVLPTIKILVMINFIGAMIGAIRGAGGFMLAMTGGGPYGEQGGATEVIGLKIFYTTFGHLQFGQGAAMAWVLGAMLIGFTVFQLKRMSNLEFRTAKS